MNNRNTNRKKKKNKKSRRKKNFLEKKTVMEHSIKMIMSIAAHSKMVSLMALALCTTKKQISPMKVIIKMANKMA